MYQATMPIRDDEFCVSCPDDPCSGVRSIGEILGELLGTIDFRPRQNVCEVLGPFRLSTASGRANRIGR